MEESRGDSSINSKTIRGQRKTQNCVKVKCYLIIMIYYFICTNNSSVSDRVIVLNIDNVR